MRAPTISRAIALSMVMLGLVPMSGCRENAAVRAPAPVAVLIDMDGVRHRVPQAESDYLAGLVAATPDTDASDHLSLDPPYRVIVDGLDLALQPDELILMHRGGTKRWIAPGVRQRVLSAVDK